MRARSKQQGKKNRRQVQQIERKEQLSHIIHTHNAGLADCQHQQTGIIDYWLP